MTVSVEPCRDFLEYFADEVSRDDEKHRACLRCIHLGVIFINMCLIRNCSGKAEDIPAFMCRLSQILHQNDRMALRDLALSLRAEMTQEGLNTVVDSIGDAILKEAETSVEAMTKALS